MRIRMHNRADFADVSGESSPGHRTVGHELLHHARPFLGDHPDLVYVVLGAHMYV